MQVGEPVPELDGSVRLFRCGMLTRAALSAGHCVVRWTSSFSHYTRRQRVSKHTVVKLEENLEVRLLSGPGYRWNRSPQRLWHHRVEKASFLRQSAALPRPSVIFCCLPTPHLCEATVHYGTARSTPVVIDVRDLWPDHYLSVFPPRWRSLFKPLLRGEYRRHSSFLRQSSGITAISATYLDWALRLAGRGAEKCDGVFALGHPSDSDDPGIWAAVETRRASWRQRLNVKGDELIVVFAGTFVSSMNFQTVLECAHFLQGGPRRIRFVFAGNGGYEADIRRRAKGLTNVAFLGWVGDSRDLKALFSLAHVGLCPYREGCTMSLPNKPFEYMAAALPQVSSLGGEMEVLIDREKIGLNYRPNDPHDLHRCLQRLATNPEERRSFGENARSLFLREYSSDVIYPRLIKHLEGIAVG